jgi:hypothetical protein
MQWRNPYRELWTDRDDDKLADIWCMQHTEVHLGFASDLSGFLKSLQDNH